MATLDFTYLKLSEHHPHAEVTSIDFETTKYDASPNNDAQKDLQIKVDEHS